ncbi:MAG: mechanosensitive ion channel [Planctomycetes bacterium]|nr:mechanosensitive ion channel [Planctomycetota bacterium]
MNSCASRWAVIAAAICLTGACLSQEPGGDPLEAELSPERLRERLNAADTSNELDDATRAQVKATLLEALTEVERAAETTTAAEGLEAEAQAAPRLLAEIRAELSQAPSPAPLEVPPEATLAQIDPRVAQATQELDQAREQAEQLRREQTRRSDRRAALDSLVTAAQQRVAAAEDALGAEGDGSPLATARRLKALAQRRAAQAEVRALRAELTNYDARRELLPARIDRATRHVTLAEQAVEAWQALANERRRQEVAEATRDAERLRLEAARTSEPVQALARENEALARLRSGGGERPGTTARLDDVTRALTDMRALLSRVRERANSVRAKVEAAGLTNPMGLLLRKELETIPDETKLRAGMVARSEEIADLQYQLIVRTDERARAGDVEQALQEHLALLPSGLSPLDRADHERILRELLTARRDLLGALVDDDERLFSRLLELDNTTRQTLAQLEDYRGFIEERILWVRSVSGSAAPNASELWGALTWLVGVREWREGLGRAAAEVAQRWLVVLLGALAIGLVLFSRFWSRGRIRSMAGVVERDPGDNFGYTARAFLIVLVRAMAFPALLLGAGWVLESPAGQPEVVRSAAAGFAAAAYALFAFELLRQVLHKEGLGEVHFRWPSAVCAHVRWHLLWFLPLKVCTGFLVAALDHQRRSDLWNDSLGRLAFVVGLGAFATFMQRVLRSGAPVADQLKRRSGSWTIRLRPVWYPLAVGLPLLLALLALRGYYYTALRLEARMQSWSWLFLGLLLLNALFLRWLRVTRRRLGHLERSAGEPSPGLAEARMATEEEDPDTRAQPADAEEATDQANAADRARALIGVELQEPGEGRLALPEIDAQTRHLFRSAMVVAVMVGTYMIWADVLPALRRLDQFQVYPGFGLGTTDAGAVDPAKVVSLADLGMAMVILAFTFVASRNVPGLLEVLILRRLPLDAGGRYAAISLARYLIVLVGVPLAASWIGITWDTVQWLAAALTFGLAFGLQEIFANFISGLIILFERPIRVGDVVTVSGTSGVVTRIRMRATTVTDFDRKELIVPNKQFVTGEVLNWVLTDAVVRVVIPVGVGYGASVEEARRVMLRVATKHAKVLKQPPPSCQLRNLGPSTFDFELWLFVSNLQDMNLVRHEVTREVHRALTKAGIDLPFPQQDVHIRSTPRPDSLPPAVGPTSPEGPSTPS